LLDTKKRKLIKGLKKKKGPNWLRAYKELFPGKDKNKSSKF